MGIQHNVDSFYFHLFLKTMKIIKGNPLEKDKYSLGFRLLNSEKVADQLKRIVF